MIFSRKVLFGKSMKKYHINIDFIGIGSVFADDIAIEIIVLRKINLLIFAL